MKIENKVGVVILIFLFLLLIPCIMAQDMSELHEVFSVSLPTSIPENLTQYEKTDNFFISKNVLSVETTIKFSKIQAPQFTHTWQADDNTRTIYDLKILRNGIDTGQPAILSYEKKDSKYVATSKPFPLNNTDVITTTYKMGNALRPVKIETLFNLSLTEFFYPFDSYKIRLMEPPNYVNIKMRKLVLDGNYVIDSNKTYFECPNRLGQWVKAPLIHRETGNKVNFTVNFDINLNEQKSKMNIVEEDKKTTIVFEPLRSTQSSLVKDYLNQSTNYVMNESNSCTLLLQYKSRFPWLLSIIFIILIFLSSYISTNKYYYAKTTKLRKYFESSILLFITPLIAIYAISIFWVNRPIIPTIFDILIIMLYFLLSFIWFRIFRFRHRKLLFKNARRR